MLSFINVLAVSVGLALSPLAYKSGLPVQHTRQELMERLYISSVVVDNVDGPGLESGVVIHSTDTMSIVLTCAHGLRSKVFAVVRGDGEILGPAMVLAVDAENDLALLAVQGFAGMALPLADSEPSRFSPVHVMGSPQGHSGAGSSGTFVGPREMPDGAVLYELIGAFIMPGSSGGILANGRAELIGIVSRVYTQVDVDHKSQARYAYPQMGYAIQLSTIRAFLHANREALDALGMVVP